MVVDSLPYYDTEPTEAERDAVDVLVDEQLPKHQPLHPSIANRDEWSPSSPLVKQELNRISAGEKLNAIDLSRYEDIEAPEQGDHAAYRRTLQRNIIAASTMSARRDNLSILKSLGANAWTMHVYQLEYSLKQVESELLGIRQATERVNIERKKSQVAAGEQLTAIEERWRALVSSNLELSVANAVLEQEIQELSQI